MIKKIAKDKETYTLTESECKKLLDSAAKAMSYTYPDKDKGYSVVLLKKPEIFTQEHHILQIPKH